MSRLVWIVALASASLQACASVPAAAAPTESRTATEPRSEAAAPRAASTAAPTPAAPTPAGSTPAPTTPAPTTAPTPEAAAAPASSTPAAAPSSSPTQTARRDLALPLGWDTLPAAAFEEAPARWNPDGDAGRLDAEDLGQLVRALDGSAPRALRAVLLLATSAAPEARDALLARLGRRIRPTMDAFPAVDVAAAAALGRSANTAGLDAGGAAALAAGLDELARGRRPHPLLVVRVECAAASVALGRNEAATLLLAVLREGTTAQDARPNWSRGAALPLQDLVFAQWRASDALTRRAGVVNTYGPEQSSVERARAADEIERALAARTASGGS
ncbi:MAG: hypothetical protein NTY35_16895 [Planctomycetota bacterium]|nr:hypothetical protein [Planctomycetota bacterium]